MTSKSNFFHFSYRNVRAQPDQHQAQPIEYQHKEIIRGSSNKMTYSVEIKNQISQ